MKRSAFNHTKVLELKTILGLPKSYVVGILDCLWDLATREAPNGAVGRLKDSKIALALDLTGDPSKVIEALIECGWLDRHDEYRFVIHDWADHCEDNVHALLARNRQFFADGRPPKLTKLQGKERDEAQAWYESHGRKKKAKECKRIPRNSMEGKRTPALALALANASLEDGGGGGGAGAREAANGVVEPGSGEDGPQRPDRGCTSAKHPTPTEMQAAWNERAAGCNWHVCRDMTDGRKEALATRRKDGDWLGNWLVALDRLTKSRFASGDGPRGWRADIDFFLRPDTVTKILEGKFDERKPGSDKRAGEPRQRGGSEGGTVGGGQHEDLTAFL